MFCWHELVTRNADKCKEFYSQLFGWTTSEKEIGGAPHTLFHREGDEHASMIQTRPEWGDVAPHWMAYVAVDDVDAAAKQAERLGGTIAVPPSDIPTVGRAVVITDPGGAPLALIKFSD
jgi:hypothetical protein